MVERPVRDRKVGGSNPLTPTIDNNWASMYLEHNKKTGVQMPAAKPDKKVEAIRLRVEQRLSLSEIVVALGVSKGSASTWLRDHPLTKEERYERNIAGCKLGALKPRTQPSKHQLSVGDRHLSGLDKARLAELAVAFRCVLQGFTVFRSLSDGDKVDFLIHVPLTDKLWKLQVKWAGTIDGGLPSVRVRCSDGRKKLRPYKEGEFDFLAGYDLSSDTVFVWSWEELRDYRTMVSVTDEASERWDKLRGT